MGLFYDNISASKSDAKASVNITTPSSIAGTLVKSMENSIIVAVKLNSKEYKMLFDIEPRYYVRGNKTTDYERGWQSSVKDYYSMPIIVLQVMLANTDIYLVEFIYNGTEEDKKVEASK